MKRFSQRLHKSVTASSSKAKELSDEELEPRSKTILLVGFERLDGLEE